MQRRAGSGITESPPDHLPIYIAEKRIDIFAALGGLVIEKKRVFPHIHDENWLKPRGYAILRAALSSDSRVAG